MKEYRKKGTQTLYPYVEGMDIGGVSISEADLNNGSPLVGDMIAVNKENALDQWLVAESYFSEHYEEAL